MARKAASDTTKKRNVVKLTVHRSKLAKQKRAAMAKSLKAAALRMSTELEDIGGFIVIAIGNDGSSAVQYEEGPIQPLLLAQWAHERLRSSVGFNDAEEHVI